MNGDPRISMDTVRLAVALANGPVASATVREAAELERLAARVRCLNERQCNEPDSGDRLDAAAARLLAKANAIAAPYGATVHQYGVGSGLWPHMVLADGSTVTP